MKRMPQTVSKKYIVQTRELFHCQIKIKIPVVYGEVLLNTCFSLLEELDKKYNSYQPTSYFSRINQNGGRWVQVDDACIFMLKTVKLVSSLTQGSYDISCMPLIRLWGFYKQEKEGKTVPTGDELNKTLAQVNYNTIAIQENFVKINAGQELITGSFIKAFAVDQVVSFLKQQGVTDAIINAGGSTIIGLNDASHLQWKINIPSPFIKGEVMTSVAITNQCFSLSGTLNNHIKIDGKPYGHIIHAKTGYPVSTAQVGVIHSSAFISDVLSTALFVVDKKEVETVVSKLKNYFEFTYYRIEQDCTKLSTICY